MKVAILNRNPDAYPGGDVLSIRDLQKALEHQGVSAANLYGHWTPQMLRQYDLVHIRHINFGWSWQNLTGTWESGVPYVITPMFYPTLGLGMGKDQIAEAIERAEAVLPFAEAEWQELRQIVGVDHPQVHFVPNGTDPLFHGPDATEEREGVLTAAARGGDKHMDLVEAFCKEAHIPCTVACGLPYESMPDLYRMHRVYVNASDSERMSRTIGEALCAGCRVLATCYNRGNEWYRPGLTEIDPQNPNLFSAKLIWAHSLCPQEDWDYRPNAAARKLTWERVAAMTRQVYAQILS